MSKREAPKRVLLDALQSAIGDGQLLAAVFTTYQLQPLFFGDHILPSLVGVEPRGSERVRRVLTAERLRELVGVVVLYDRHGMVHDGPMHQQVQAIPVDRPHGYVLHAKHALLLVAPKDEPEADRLVLLTTSANLTEAAWWRNVEVADLQTLRVGQPSSLQPDVLALVNSLEGPDGLVEAPEARPAIDAIRTFLGRVPAAEGGPRLWLGEQPVSAFLKAQIGAKRPVKSLELLAPFVEDKGAPVQALVEALRPGQARVWIPRDRDGKVAASQEWVDAVRGLQNTRLAELASVDRSMGKGATAERFVHAKVIRVKLGEPSETWVLVGSPNLTRAGQTGAFHGPHANVETAIWRRADEMPRLLEALSKQATPEGVERSTDEGDKGDGPPLPLRLRFNWEAGEAAARWELDCDAVARVVAPGQSLRTGPPLFEVAPGEGWSLLPPASARALRGAIETGHNVVMAWAPGHADTPILVEETGWAARPPVLTAALTTADILEHWSLLSGLRRELHTEQVMQRQSSGGDEAPVDDTPGFTGQTMFHKLAGVLHAFFVLEQRLQEAVAAKRLRAVEALVLSKQHDSLRTLLERLPEEQGFDAVQRLLVLLSARSLVERLDEQQSELMAAHPASAAAVRALVDDEAEERAWAGINLEDEQGAPPGPAFRAWFRSQWFQQGGTP